MADDSANEDSWLYGESNADSQEPEEENKPEPEEQESEIENKDENAEESQTDPVVEEHFEDPEPIDHRENENGDGNESRHGSNDNGDSDSESDDDINVVIGDIKSGPSYSGINLKQRTPLLAAGAPNADKPKQVQGKFNIEEFEQVGTINGIQIHEFSIDSLEDKPWRKPGADVTDYFNYGFNEDTWRAYCERQKRMRIHESGTGLLVLGNTSVGSRVVTALSNENSKYTGAPVGVRKAGPPPGRRMTGSIDVIGGTGLASRRNEDDSPGLPTTPTGTAPGVGNAKENVIQVMTADRREYSRGSKVFPDTTLPPPQMSGPQFPPPHMPEPYYEPEPYFNSYEPTQDLQWGDPNWAPSDHMKQLTPGMNMMPMGPPPAMVGPPLRMPPPMGGPPPAMMMNIPPHMPGPRPPLRSVSPNDERDRDRDRDRDRMERERERDRDIRERDREMRDRDRDRERDRDPRERDRETRERDREPRERDRETRDRETRERDRETRERDEVEHSPSRDREDSRGRSHRERSHRRDRSRSRSRRHKSRSRSPSHRSHRKKKSSHRKDKEDSD